MSGEPLVRSWTRPARLRGTADDVALGLPVVLLAALLPGRLAGWGAGLGVGLAALAALVLAARVRSRRFGQAWLVTRLNATHPELEDSADLLLAAPDALGPLQRLQRARLEARLAGAPADLLPTRSAHRLALAWGTGLSAMAAIVLWPVQRPEALAPSSEGAVATPGVPRLIGQRLTVVPPVYTGLPARSLATLDARAPQGSRLVWTLAFAPRPRGATLVFLDGHRVPLAPEGERWTAALPLDHSALYRIALEGAPPARLHRLDAIADQPPRVAVRTPPRTLGIATAGQRAWSLVFTATDDYGVAPNARVRVTVAAGAGELVTFRERALNVAGTGPPRARRFAITLDLPALGFTGPGDLVAQLGVADTRPGAPQTARSPSLILRRLAPKATQASGLDAAVHTVLPGYLRSQRQVINDAVALLAERRALPPPKFGARAQSIGADQHALRMHYGDLVGQETESAAAPLTTAAPQPTALGRQEDVLAEFEEEKENPEAATLFDPATKARLSTAVDQMWQSELALNQADPARALPFANKALALLKQVQQATRMFLARVSTPELPAPDETRRLTGKRDALAPNDLAVPSREGSEAAAADAWSAIDGLGRGDPERVARWSREQGARVGDPLALQAALDAARRDPGCGACRDRLRALVWAGLRRPPPGTARRLPGDAAGRRYLMAIGGR